MNKSLKFFEKPSKIITHLRDLGMDEDFIPQPRQLESFCEYNRNKYYND